MTRSLEPIDLDGLRRGPANKGVIPVGPGLCSEIKYFAQHKGGSIRDGVMLSLNQEAAGAVAPGELRL